jgi:hypothetical protein
MHQSVIAYAKARYFWVAIVLSVISIVLYAWHDPHGPANGGTWLGYTLGTIGAVIIIWLMLLGIRKRAYSSTTGSVQGWTSAHIYIGSSLLIVATLHGGLQFGWNVHTLAYVLMCLVILSGFFGIYAYLRYPNLLTENRIGRTRVELFSQIADLDGQAIRIAGKVDAETNALVQSAADRTVVGGGWWSQITERDHSKVLLPATFGGESGSRLTDNTDQNAVISLLAERLAKSPGGEETNHLQHLLGVLANKQTLLRKVRQDIKLHGLLQLWLYVHVPLSFALLAALTIHIISVFIYW